MNVCPVVASMSEDVELGPFPDTGCLCKRANPGLSPGPIFLTGSPVYVRQRIMCECGHGRRVPSRGPRAGGEIEESPHHW